MDNFSFSFFSLRKPKPLSVNTILFHFISLWIGDSPKRKKIKMSPSSNSSLGSSSSCSSSCSYIEHQVSKMDTLAGIAIKYGVEVADIRRLNGLATDIQMFALKTLLIPSPGRHPPSPVVSSSVHPQSSPPRANGIDKTPPHPRYTNLLDSFESLRLNSSQPSVSPAMSTLQKYYNLKPSNQKGEPEGTEMVVCRTGSLDSLNEDQRSKSSPFSAPPRRNKKKRNFFNSFFSESEIVEAGNGDSEKSNEKSVRRRQKADTDSRVDLTERSLKDENGGGSSDFSQANGKSLSTRQKSPDSDQGWLSAISVGLGDSVIAGGLPGFHKSSSTTSLQEDTGSSSFWPTSKWSLKPDLQALSTASINIPLFDGLPKPITGRRSKAALD